MNPPSVNDRAADARRVSITWRATRAWNTLIYVKIVNCLLLLILDFHHILEVGVRIELILCCLVTGESNKKKRDASKSTLAESFKNSIKAQLASLKVSRLSRNLSSFWEGSYYSSFLVASIAESPEDERSLTQSDIFQNIENHFLNKN